MFEDLEAYNPFAEETRIKLLDALHRIDGHLSGKEEI